MNTNQPEEWLNEFHRVNVARQHEALAPAHSLQGLVMCTIEEVGELAGAVSGVTGEKKRKAHLTNDDVLDAVADAITYLSLIADRAGCADLAGLIATTFNMVSDRAGSAIKVRLPAALNAARSEHDNGAGRQQMSMDKFKDMNAVASLMGLPPRTTERDNMSNSIDPSKFDGGLHGYGAPERPIPPVAKSLEEIAEYYAAKYCPSISNSFVRPVDLAIVINDALRELAAQKDEEIATLREQLSVAKEDTARLDWLEQTGTSIGYNVELSSWGVDFEAPYEVTIRNGIDAARQ